MDYDDSDFQHQNFHIIGEDNSNYSPVLRSFPLPKFDLGEHLQVHLKFDGLEEPGDFSGIQAQNESNWIEGFSAGSEALALCPSAAESRPISSHNNAWSEATSSKAIEMLLKSAGEDEMKNKTTGIGLDVQHGVAVINCGMDLHLVRDDSVCSKSEEVVNTDSTPQPAECEHVLSGVNEEPVRNSSHIEDACETSKGEKSETEGIDVSGGDGGNVAEQLGVTQSQISSSPKVIQGPIHEKVQNDNSLVDTHLETIASYDYASGNLQSDSSPTPIDTMDYKKVQMLRACQREKSPTYSDCHDENAVGSYCSRSETCPSVEKNVVLTETHNVLSPKKLDGFLQAVNAEKVPSKDGQLDNQVVIAPQEHSLLVVKAEEFSVSVQDTRPQTGAVAELNYVNIHEKSAELVRDFVGECETSMTAMKDKMDSVTSPVESINADGNGLPGLELAVHKVIANAEETVVAESIEHERLTTHDLESKIKNKNNDNEIDNAKSAEGKLNEMKKPNSKDIDALSSPEISPYCGSDLSPTRSSAVKELRKQSTDLDTVDSVYDSCIMTGKNNNSSILVQGTSLTASEASLEKGFAAKELGDQICLKGNLVHNSISLENNSRHNSKELRDGGQNPLQPNSGSFTVASCSEHSQDEMVEQEQNKGPSDQTDSSSINLPCCPELERGPFPAVSTINDPKECNASKNNKVFNTEGGEIVDLSDKDIINGCKASSNIRSSEHGQQTPPMSSTDKLNHNELEGQSMSGKEKLHDIVSKSTGKGRSRSTTNADPSKRRPVKRTPASKKMIEKKGNSYNTSVISFGTSSASIQLSYTDGSGIRQSCPSTVHASSLPDLNTATFSAAVLHQAFTYSQQVQLRAQIFVYGSLIQGVPPDEACMVSAFGPADGQNVWEGVWHAVVEKYQNLKSPLCNFDTTPLSCSVAKLPEQISSCSSVSNQSSSKSTPPTISSSKSVLSPMWNTSILSVVPPNMSRGLYLDAGEMLSPLHSLQHLHVRQKAGNSTSWLVQSPFPMPTVASAITSDTGMTERFQASPFAEPAQIITGLSGSSLQFMSPNALPAAGGAVSVSLPSTLLVDATKTTLPGSNKHISSDQRSRKRKKDTVSSYAQILPVLQPVPELEPASGASVTKHQPLSICFSVSSNSSDGVPTGDLVSTVSPIVSPAPFQIVRSDAQRITYSGETSGKFEQARLQAEDAASASVRLCQSICSELARQKSSGLVSDVEEKLASAAVAASAAAAVAKAAAAAAKVAADAAMQAKFMADEALMSVKGGRTLHFTEPGHDGRNSMPTATPVPILKGKDNLKSSSSIISAAREAARRRVEAASAATKRAENLDAIVKAAELAAEAVSHVGKIISIGGALPFTLSDVLVPGPEGQHKVQQFEAEQGKMKSVHDENPLENSINAPGQSTLHCSQPNPNENEICCPSEGENLQLSSGIPEKPTEDNSGIPSSTAPSEDGGVQFVDGASTTSFQKGTAVEVLSDVKGMNRVWLSARILKLKDGKAYVCYNKVLSNEGSGKLKEWIPLEDDGMEAPKIRIAHSMPLMKYGARKRRRSNIGTHSWAIGDRVDALVNDGWREGVIKEKSKEEGKSVVYFPAGGDTSTVSDCDLRPSLIWTEGRWTELPGSSVHTQHLGDTPQGKRQKLSKPESKDHSEAGVLGVDRNSENTAVVASTKLDELKPLALSAEEKTFSIGNNVNERNSSSILKRSGLQKEGSRVVFGIPKPGKKKRKFMDVAKQCVVDKPGDRTDSIKFTKYLMPQESHGLKNKSKLEPKGTQVTKLRVAKAVRPQNVRMGTAADKYNSSISSLAASSGSETTRMPSLTKKVSEKNVSESKNPMKPGSIPNSTGIAGLLSESSFQPVSEVPSGKVPGIVLDSEQGNWRYTRARHKLARNENRDVNFTNNSGKTNSDSMEPRRSVRRIQPTSRLLEGLQSSSIFRNIPSSTSHDKGTNHR